MNYDFGTQPTRRVGQQGPDPYEVLNLPRDADVNAIRNKFRTLTRLHHPDRNRRNPNYDPAYYAAVCNAYETLTDPKKRAYFDQSAASQFHVLRSQALDTASRGVAPAQVDFQPSGRMSDGDLKRFNDAFEKQRRADANDRGYGVVSGRVTEQEAKSGNRPIDAPVNRFGGATKVGEAEFNRQFQSDLQAKRRQRAQAIQERGEGEPEGWFQGTVLGASDISLFDGVIVNQERDDFSGAASGLHYADYMAGFETITEQLPEDHPYYNASGDIKKQYSEKLSQLSSVPERGHNMSFQQAEMALQQQREREMQAERDRNKQVVLKYREQYSSQDLLPPSSGPQKRDAAHQQSLNQTLNDRAFSRF